MQRSKVGICQCKTLVLQYASTAQVCAACQFNRLASEHQLNSWWLRM